MQHICSALPPRGKRLVFLVSLSSRLNQAEQFDKETRQKLNQVMCLAAGDNSLVLPYELREVIWRGKSGTEIFRFDPTSPELPQETIHSMAKNVLDSMPDWLRYDDIEHITQDVIKLLGSRQQVFGF